MANRIVLLREWLLRQLASLERQEQEVFWVQDELDYLDTDQYAEAYSEILKKYRREEAVFDFTTQYLENYGDFPNQDQGEENVFDFGLQEEELLRRMIVKEHFKPLRRDVKRFEFIDTIGLYDQLFSDETIYRRMTNETEVPAQWQEICKQTKEKLSCDELFCEDATPFLYLKELVEGTRMNTEVRHLFIDEE